MIAGALQWGAAVGIQESPLRAVVADLVPAPRRATAYGVYAARLRAATAADRALTGWLYDTSIPVPIASIAVIQITALGRAAAIKLRLRTAVLDRADHC